MATKQELLRNAAEAAEAYRQTLTAKTYHPSEKALKKYLQEHPNADRRKHEVRHKEEKKEKPSQKLDKTVGRGTNHIKKLEKTLETDKSYLDKAKDDKERAEIERDIKVTEDAIAKHKKEVEQATADRESRKKKPKTAALRFAAALAADAFKQALDQSDEDDDAEAKDEAE